MSSSIAIPTRLGYDKNCNAGSSSSSSSTYSSSPRTPDLKQKGVTTESPASTGHNRRTSWLSSSFSQSEHTVINIGDPEGPPRLITCVRSSQGYEWNQEIFLPSYVDCEFESLERKRDPVHEITLSEEEIKDMLPQ